jgi:RNA methyltransferase, TrmH family
MTEPVFISSRDNTLLKALRKLRADNAAYRKTGRIWLEGEHLCSAALARGVPIEVLVVSESFLPLAPVEYAQAAIKSVVIPDALFHDISGLESPAKLGFVVELPKTPAMEPLAPTVILDRVQDAGNVGSILRSAGAFGFRQVLALQGTAALWSPKVLRAGMGAHFGLRLIEGLALADLDTLELPLVVTSSHQGEELSTLDLPHPCAWIMGHEGQGVSPALIARASLFARIAQPGGEESLNVAAAAAICLHTSSLGCVQDS